MAWPPRARNLVLEANNSNWYDWYEDFMAEFGRNAAAVAIDPESKAPDGTLYTDKEAMREALKAADWPIPERPVRPVLGDDDEESLEKYLDEYEAYLSDRELRLVHKRRVHEDYYSAAAAILQYVPKHVFCDLLADIESPRGQLAALRANFASFEPFLGLKRDLEYEALQATYSWTAVEDWIPKWAELIRKLQQVDSSVVHDHRYLGDLSNLLTNSSAPASQTAGLILQVRYLALDGDTTTTVAELCAEITDYILHIKKSEEPRTGRQQSTRRGARPRLPIAQRRRRQQQ